MEKHFVISLRSKKMLVFVVFSFYTGTINLSFNIMNVLLCDCKLIALKILIKVLIKVLKSMKRNIYTNPSFTLLFNSSIDFCYLIAIIRWIFQKKRYTIILFKLNLVSYKQQHVNANFIRIFYLTTYLLVFYLKSFLISWNWRWIWILCIYIWMN